MKWSQLKVGIIVMISVALLCTLLFLMTSASGMSVFARKLVVTTYFENSAGLKVGAPVNLEGVTIGEVKKVRSPDDPARKLTPVKVIDVAQSALYRQPADGFDGFAVDGGRAGRYGGGHQQPDSGGAGDSDGSGAAYDSRRPTCRTW